MLGFVVVSCLFVCFNEKFSVSGKYDFFFSIANRKAMACFSSCHVTDKVEKLIDRRLKRAAHECLPLHVNH